jgi:alanine racemase
VTLTLTVDADRWRAQVRSVLDAYGDVIAVVKGNGYGFGIERLASEALGLGATAMAVGTVHELDALPPVVSDPLVLTPVLERPRRPAIMTISSVEQAAVLPGGTPIAVKLASSMRRYGATPEQQAALLAAVEHTGLDVRLFVLHLPFDADPGEVDTWLARTPQGVPLTVSHLDAAVVADLRRRHPQRRIPIRLGTALWHGDKSFLALRALVIETRTVRGGEPAGYRHGAVPGDGTIVMVGAGTAHGVHPLPDSRSPFHFKRTRLALVEPPHMHTSMVWVPTGDACPAPGEEVDVQQPLSWVRPDRIREH